MSESVANLSLFDTIVNEIERTGCTPARSSLIVTGAITLSLAELAKLGTRFACIAIKPSTSQPVSFIIKQANP